MKKEEIELIDSLINAHIAEYSLNHSYMKADKHFKKMIEEQLGLCPEKIEEIKKKLEFDN